MNIESINNKLIRLADIAETEEDIEPATINRQDRGRYIQITASLVRAHLTRGLHITISIHKSKE